mmetsp:Transcript_63675/g.186276  ORF Transcript_63675/g.186276 Transcript_63675/m.186276 type:complete len:207 (+) Transcript_63675:68-688(+)
MRQTIVNYLPVFGPLLASDIVPSFEDVDKLIQTLALIQGLLLSCLASCFTEALECTRRADDVEETDVIWWAVLAFDCLCLGIFLTLVLYAYVVYFIDQSKEEDAQACLSKFWNAGGKLVFSILVFLTLIGAGAWSKQVHIATECLYGRPYGIRIGGHHVLPWLAAFSCLLIHWSFRSMFHMTGPEASPSAHRDGDTLVPQTDPPRS